MRADIGRFFCHFRSLRFVRCVIPRNVTPKPTCSPLLIAQTAHSTELSFRSTVSFGTRRLSALQTCFSLGQGLGFEEGSPISWKV